MMTTTPSSFLHHPLRQFLLFLLLSKTSLSFHTPQTWQKQPSQISNHNQPSPTSSTTLSSSSSSEEEEEEEETINGLSRRKFNELSLATLGLTTTYIGTREVTPQDYGLWGILPVGPYKRKKTVLTTIVPDRIWTLEQKFGILNVQVPVRMTIIKLFGDDNNDQKSSSSSLFVYDPIAATPECLSLIQNLIDEHGPISHIVLGSVAIEHKVYAGVFAQKFPSATVWIQPGQYSFPINLSSDPFLGFPSSRTHILSSSTTTDIPKEWSRNGLTYRTLGPFISRDGAFGETVMYHEPTKTLLVTDTVVEVDDVSIPEIYDDDPAPLLYHARDTVLDVVEDSLEVRRKGWRRVLLFGLFFNPSGIEIKTVEQALEERRPDINPDFAGIYPWDWIGDKDVESINAIKGGLLVAPILQKLILNRSPIETLDFADEVSKWSIERIIAAHLKNDLKYTGKDYRNAFRFLEVDGPLPNTPKPLDADFKTLNDAEINLMESGAISKRPPMPGGSTFSRQDILDATSYQCRAGVCAQQASS